MLAERESVLNVMTGKNLYKLQMTYKPQEVITKAKDDSEESSMRETSHAARLFRYLVKCETPTTITLYFCATHEDIDALVDIRDRLKQEKDIKPFNEYRDMNGKIVIEWRSKFGPWLDVGSRLPSQLNFRFPEQHAVTLAYGEIRDHACTVLIARSRLTKPVKISLVAIPGSTQEHEVPSKYIGFVNIQGLNTLLEVGLFKVGSKATLCFYQPLLIVEPQRWQCVVKLEIPHVEHPGLLVLMVTRPAGSEQQVNVAKYPSPDMRTESDYSVWLYPHGSDKYCTGKTTFAADILISIFEIFSLKANCYAPSNAAIDAFAGKVPLKLKPIGYHDPPKEWSIGINSVGSAEPTAEFPPCDNATATLSEEQMIWMQAYNNAASSMSWNIPTELQYPNFSSRGLHVRALQRAKLMDTDGQMSIALPKDVPEAYLPWARQYYRLDGRVTKPPKEGDEDKPTFRQLTLRLFDDTLKSADYVITTCGNAADKRLRRCTNPRVVIIDEAGSARELETLMVMYHNLESADMFIILGDAKRSPVVPLLHHKLNDDDPNSPAYNIFAPQLATSLMARQIANGIRHSTFTKI